MIDSISGTRRVNFQAPGESWRQAKPGIETNTQSREREQAKETSRDRERRAATVSQCSISSRGGGKWVEVGGLPCPLGGELTYSSVPKYWCKWEPWRFSAVPVGAHGKNCSHDCPMIAHFCCKARRQDSDNHSDNHSGKHADWPVERPPTVLWLWDGATRPPTCQR